MSHAPIPHLGTVSLGPCHQSVTEGVLTSARDKPRNGSAGDIPRKVPVARSSGEVRPAPEFPRVRTEQLDHAVLCGLPGSLGLTSIARNSCDLLHSGMEFACAIRNRINGAVLAS